MNAVADTESRPGPELSDRAPGRAVDLILSLGVFVGALLLFQVQPMIGKFILPWFGGSPSVWTICLLFFQIVLLLGYLYAHLLATRFPPRTQAVVHLIFALVALATLPIIPSDRWKPTGDTNPSLRIFLLLLSTIGPPYLVLSATGPLLQSWFGAVRPGRSPYRLYALSNAASLAALVSYPLFLEPSLSRRSQAVVWSIGFVVYALVLAACVFSLSPKGERVRVRGKRGTHDDQPLETSIESNTFSPRAANEDVAFPLPGSPPHPGPLPQGGEGVTRALWLALPACATILLMASTNTLCQEVAVIPFLWVAPLGLYLLSFIISFDSPRWYHRGYIIPAMFVAIGVLCWVMLRSADQVDLVTQILVVCTALFLCCLACHGEVYRLRPHSRVLTRYYLHIATGGALGGIFVAVIAPLVFKGFAELQLGFGLAVLLVMAVLMIDPASPMYRGQSPRRWRFIIGGAMILGIGLGAGANRYIAGAELLERSRNFHGVLTIYVEAKPLSGKQVEFHHGGITHGLQFEDPALRHVPTAYYGLTSGVGRLLGVMNTTNPGPRKIGLVGQGVGTLAAYGRPGDTFRSYELNPEVDRLARKYFTFIADCAGAFTTILGDARLTLEREPDQGFDLLALDAFSGDAIPVHLLTREAFDLYLRHLKPDGVIAVHISNQHLDLSPVVFAHAERLGMPYAEVIDPGDDRDGRSPSQWILMSRDGRIVSSEIIRRAVRPAAQQSQARILWTDDHTSLLPLLR